MALKKTPSTTLTGIVIPTEWNEDHDVITAALATPDEREYRIVGNRKGRELLGYLQRQVEATGQLSEDEKGKMAITVRSYIVKQT